VTLQEAALAVAITKLGVHEVGGNNCGPEVEEFLASVGLGPGNAWCAAFLYFCFRQAARQLGIVNPCPRTAKAVRMFALAEAPWRDSNPSVGSIYVLDHGTPGDVLTEWKNGRYTDDGHAGIIACVNDTAAPIDYAIPGVAATLLGLPTGTTTVSVPPGCIAEISGNTNRAGSREGDSVWLKVGQAPEDIHGGVLLGYVNLDRAAQQLVA